MPTMVAHNENNGIVTHCKQETTIDRLVAKQDKYEELIAQLITNGSKIDMLSESIGELKDSFSVITKCLHTIQITQATLPSQTEISTMKEDLVRHRTWFQILGAATGILATLTIALIMFIVNKIL